MSKLIVIADDFTGANDTGVQLTKKGASVTVALGDAPVECDITVINTESRAVSPEEARSAVSSAVEGNVSDDTRVVFKKIDSTYRGNVGAEVDAAAAAFGADLIVVAGAIPAAGRTSIDGRCLVNGIPLLETEFATDPKTPISFSEIDKIIGSQSDLPCRNVFLDDVRAGKLSNVLKTAAASGVRQIVIADAETDDDLAVIATSLLDVDVKMVLVGAAGIAGQLPKSLFSDTNSLPVLILAGSMSETVQKQVENCEEHGLHVINVDSHDIWFHADKTIEDTIRQANELISAGKHCAVRTASHKNERQRAAEFCREQGITGSELGASVASFFGTIGRKLMESSAISGTLLTGGDIAIAVAEAIGADGYVIDGEVLPCIPYGHFTDHETMVVTKAGGFGAPDAMVHIINYIQENS